jgi:mRNA interferase RelE/StbE
VCSGKEKAAGWPSFAVTAVHEKAGRAAPTPSCRVVSALGDGRLLQDQTEKAGYRLVYQVDDNRIVVIVVAVGKRENFTVYRAATKRLTE